MNLTVAHLENAFLHCDATMRRAAERFGFESSTFKIARDARDMAYRALLDADCPLAGCSIR